ncbi:hypothetical protein LTR53_012553 [Teratosphaeriaceae sp. CCFEE 6253]|nr:hypothetical protein LTR53_012553 [Teratosphaeriaceae sp. CCFEE 6253]
MEPEEELVKYDPEESLISRLETAVNSFNARKMQPNTRNVFEKLMVFGGFGSNARMFQSGMTKKQMKQEGMDKEEMAQASPHFGVIEPVSDAFWNEWERGTKPVWVVDFDTVAKAFLSSVFMYQFDWYQQSQVATACQVLRDFYNYLTEHSVCPEYADQLVAARGACDLAEEELPKLAVVDRSLPGAFNAACSTLFGGTYANVFITREAQDSWAQGADNIGLDHEEAVNIFRAGLAAYGTAEQCVRAGAPNSGDALGFKTVAEERLGLEIVAVEMPTDAAKELYAFASNREGFKNYIHAMGKLICKRWTIPFDAPVDLPKHLMQGKVDQDERFEFLVEAETLAYCVPGMKMEALVKEADLGIKWIDGIETVYPSFYTWLANEGVLGWKEPGPPTSWIERAEEKKKRGVMVEVDAVA